MTDTTQIFRLKSDVRYRTIADEGIVLRQNDGEVLVVNGVGVRVVELIAGGASFQELLTTLENEYDIHPEQLRTDVLSYIEELKAAGVLEPVD